ncbi:MAG: hypothetical protein D6805_00520 [Planctomycetota bacterium]|nr:MAG: hypothetical protein D6805_00520 [Planctomycetota bacterium]
MILVGLQFFSEPSKTFRTLGEKLFEKSLSPKNPFSKTSLFRTFLKKGSVPPKTSLSETLFRKKGFKLPKNFSDVRGTLFKKSSSYHPS